MRAKFINEKFTQDSDPIKDMNIGIKHKIEELLYELSNNRNFSYVTYIKSPFSMMLCHEHKGYTGYNDIFKDDINSWIAIDVNYDIIHDSKLYDKNTKKLREYADEKFIDTCPSSKPSHYLKIKPQYKEIFDKIIVSNSKTTNKTTHYSI